MNPQMQMWLGPTRRIPVLTEGMRLTIAAIDLAGGRPLSEARFNRAGGGEDYAVQTRVLRDLLSKGLIEVVSLGPAVYRVTKLGRLARSMR
jgi:hypothetical protein